MLLLLIGAMAAIFFISEQNNANSTQVVTDIQSRLLTSLATNVALQVDGQVLQYRRDATQIATDPEVVAFMSSSAADQTQGGAALLRRLDPVLSTDPDYRQLLMLDANGRTVLSNQPGVQGQDYSDREFYTLGKVAPSGDPYISDIALAEDHRSEILYVAAPIRDPIGKLLGVTAVRLAPDHVAAPLGQRNLTGEHRYGFLVSKDGLILANSFTPSLNFRVLGSLDPVQVGRVKQQYLLERVVSMGLDNLSNYVAGATETGFTQAHLMSSKESDVVGWAPVGHQRWTVMVSEDQALFTAGVQNLTRGQFFNAAILAVIIGGLVIFASRIFEGTERQSLSDPLTGLANRRFFHEIFLREMRRSQRSNQPVTIVLMDIDYFKGVNDTYGHHVGDEVLEQVSGIMLQSVRATDFVIRYGGEEFIILLPETRTADAAQVADKLRKTIGDTILESTSRPGMTLKVTVSAGVAAFPTDGPNGEAVILKADKALYNAKQGGRDKVVIAADLDDGAAGVQSIAGGRRGA
jgi:diguanylate cyclase (GGDEF)-like protein